MGDLNTLGKILFLDSGKSFEGVRIQISLFLSQLQAE